MNFPLVREAGAWKLQSYHPLLSREQALEARDEPLYLVIAGSFRTSRAAERHLQRYYGVLSANDSIASIERAGDFANLRPGWFIVLPDDGQASSLGEARQVRARLAKSGVSAYVRRIH